MNTQEMNTQGHQKIAGLAGKEAYESARAYARETRENFAVGSERTKDIPLAIENLEKQTASLNDTFGFLAQRLTPFVRASCLSEAKIGSPRTTEEPAPFARKLNDINDSLTVLEYNIRQILELLEI